MSQWGYNNPHMSVSTVLRLIFLCGLAAVAAWLLYVNLHRAPEAETDRARGPLTEELVAAAAAAPVDAKVFVLDAVYSKFIPTGMSLEKRATLLRKNGFGCKIEPYKTKRADALTLRCLRTMQGAWGCKGFDYFAFQTIDDGWIFEPEGSMFVIAADGRTNDRCPKVLDQQQEYDRAAQ